jgi:hypothetical protein
MIKSEAYTGNGENVSGRDNTATDLAMVILMT